MTSDKFIAWVQAILSGIYLTFTFIIILIYELGYARVAAPGQEKTFDSMVSWLTGGAGIVLFFWLQRARTGGVPDPAVTTTTQTTQTVTTPTDPTSPVLSVPPTPTVVPVAPADPQAPASSGG